MKKPVLNVERLKEKRIQKGWNKLEASEHMKIPQSVYLRYENGDSHPSYSALRNIALSLGTSVEYLTGQIDDDRPSDYLIPADDDRLICILETYRDAPDENRERLYKYARKLKSIK